MSNAPVLPDANCLTFKDADKTIDKLKTNIAIDR